MHAIGKWLVTIVAAAALAGSQTEAITGRVVRAHDGTPLRFAPVEVVSADGAIRRTTTSDRDGRFAIGELAPGRYSIEASARGFASVASYVAVPQGDAPLTLRVPRGGTITGRVVDARGRPVSGVPVHGLMSQFRGGREILRRVNSRSVVSDDRGLFRLFGLEPGSYYVAALPGSFGDDPAGRLPNHPVRYHPGTSSLGDAQPVMVAADGEHVISDLLVRPVESSTIDGIVFDSRGLPLGGVEVVLVPASGPISSMLPMATTRADGRFSFRDVAPGAYVLQNLPTPTTPSEFGSSLITAGGGPLSISLHLQPPGPVRGKIVFEDGAPDFRPDRLSVLLQSARLHESPIARGARARVLADWTLEITNIWGPHSVHLAEPANGWMLKQVLVGGEDFTGRAIDFTDLAASSFMIVLTSRAASISGTVVDRNRRPLPEASVLLYSTDAGRWFEDRRAIRVARTDRDGRFHVNGITSDVYLLALHEVIEDGDWPPRPTVLEALRASALTISITEPREYQVTLGGAK